MTNTKTRSEEPAMTEQQREFTDPNVSKFSRYRQLLVGDSSWASYLFFEFYQLTASLPGILGMGTRTLLFPSLCKSCGNGIAIGRSVGFKQANRISLGQGIAIDDFASLDVRSAKAESTAGIEIGNRVVIGRHSSIVAK